LDASWFGRDATAVAPDLLGCEIRLGNRRAIVVETEAYTSDDPASHSFRGRTPRTAAMFGPPGRWYVYLIYGIHHCANIVTGADGDGQAVLVRAAVLDGPAGPRFVDGPGRLCRATGVDRTWNGVDVVAHAPRTPLTAPAPTVRIGISVGVDAPRRWRLGADDISAISTGSDGVV
jgi:DNA-3-methyladenine glycosylase